MMEQREIPRRTVLKTASAAGLTTVTIAGPARAAGAADRVIPWLDQPDRVPRERENIVGHPLIWENLRSRIVPNDEFFTIKHYNEPQLNASEYRLTVDGHVARPGTFSLAALRARPHRSVEFTVECSGNNAAPFFIGGVGNARWTGTPLHLLLRQVRPTDDATEVVFWGADAGTETIRDNTGILGGGTSGRTTADSTGGLDLTITEHFARSMSLKEAMAPENLLCFEMNGEPLPRDHGFPVRLIAPGWYGVANVKWLTHIEIADQRYAGKFMARDYVSIREERFGGEPLWTFHTVSHTRLKSAPARVTRRGTRHTITGVAWGAPVARVEVQIDDGRWRAADLDRPRDRGGFAWRLWRFDWGTPAAGVHTVRSRAFDTDGAMQPPPDDPYLTSRVTFWENNGQITRTIRIG